MILAILLNWVILDNLDNLVVLVNMAILVNLVILDDLVNLVILVVLMNLSNLMIEAKFCDSEQSVNSGKCCDSLQQPGNRQ